MSSFFKHFWADLHIWNNKKVLRREESTMRDEWRNVKSGSALTEMILKCLFLVSRCSTNFSVRGVVSFCVWAGERRQSSALTDREGREQQGGEGGERGRGEARTTNNREEKGGQRRVMGYDALQQTMTMDEGRFCSYVKTSRKMSCCSSRRAYDLLFHSVKRASRRHVTKGQILNDVEDA